MPVMKNIGLLFSIIGIIISLFGAYTYFTIIRPVMGLDIQPQGVEPVTLSPLVLDVVLSAHNPGEATEIPGAEINMYLNDEYLGSGTLDKVRIGAGEKKTLRVRVSIDRPLSDVLALTNRQQTVKIDGKIETRFFPIPIPRVPLPIPFELSQLVSSEVAPDNSKLPLILAAAQEDPEMTIEEALENEEVIAKIEEQERTQLTEEKIEELKQSIPSELQGKSVAEILRDPELLEKYGQK
ncbi:MAG: hypothetical protein V3V92_03505 [Candidatus Hydrothermarchaeales archaeon]